MAMLAGRQHFVSSGNHPKSHSPGGGRPIRVHNRTQPTPGCTICKAGTIVGTVPQCGWYVSTGTGLPGYNMYAYCNNNPVMGYDPNGNMIIHNSRMFSTMDLFMKFLYGERSLYAINILYKKM